jgi:TolB-like protein/Flp pilus assembly protein TadD
MKRCPECRRDYYDDTLLYCLDDGNALLEGPATASSGDEPATAILHETAAPGEAATRAQINTTNETAMLPANTGDIVPTSRGLDKRLLAVPLLLAIIVVGGYFGYRYLKPAAADQINSIAVLPFENRSGSADTDYLSDGLAESLVYRLSQLPSLKVSPTNSVLRYKGKDADIAQIAKELEVDAVMSGRLTQRGDDLTISVELTDARTKKLIWAEQYARKMSDLLTTQSEIASAVTQKLQLKLSGDDTKGLTKRYTNDNEAYQLYLKGRFFWNKRTPEGLKAAIEQFKAASDKDPNFALAYVGIADSYLVGLYNARGRDKDDIPIAKAYATRAFEIDPSLAEVNASLGLVNMYLWNWADAEKYYKRAIELNPNYPTARHWYSRLLREQGKYDEAFEQIMLAQKDDSLSVSISNNVGEVLLGKGDIPGAIAESRRGLEIGTSWVQYRTLAHCSLILGQKDEALANAQKAVEVLNDSPVTLKVLGYVQAAIGNRPEALAIAQAIEVKFEKGQADGRDVAVVYAGLGENDKVFEWLEKDFQNHASSLTEVRLEYPFAQLHSDPRFKDLLKRMNLPE